MSAQPLPFSSTKGAGRNPGDSAISVSGLIAQIKGALADAFPRSVAVIGEISNFKRHSSGHLYFRLKDAGAAIDAVMFRPDAARLKFRPADGMEIVAEGRVDVYDVRGQLQLYVERMTPKGAGALELAFRQLRDKLQREGLFDPQVKKPIPPYPRAVGVVTSPTGAALRDIRRTLSRRWPSITMYLVPVPVQGEAAAEAIAKALRLLDANADRLGIDTIIVGRGGGSLEDLWAFNEEAVARAVYAASTPVISAVGHETDITICDLVADVRAATPTAAAELAVPDAAQVARHLGLLARRLKHRAGESIAAAQAALAGALRSVVFRDPAWRVRTQMQRLDELSHRMRAGLAGELAAYRGRLTPAAGRLAAIHPARLAEQKLARLHRAAGRMAWALGARSKHAGETLAEMQQRLARLHPRHKLNLATQKIHAAKRQLEAMSYRSVLKRGYAVTRDSRGAILRSAGQVKINELIQTELAYGKINSRVTSTGETAPTKTTMPARKTQDVPGGRHDGENPSLFD